MRNGWLIVALLALSSIASAAERAVSSAEEIDKAMRDAKPGDVLVMKDGKWTDQAIKFVGKGTEAEPITLRAQTPGKVMLDGETTLGIDGEWLVVSGLLFTDSKTDKDAVDIKGDNNRLTESAVVSLNRGGPWIHFTGGRHNRMDHCYLEGHARKEVRLQVEVEKDHPNEHLIDHNHFGPRPPLGANGGETMRIGYSHQSMLTSRTLVEHNLFERCDGEIEIISSKSCENVYRYNTFTNCEGTLTLRHGNRCIVDGNFFLGNGGKGKPSGGIRVIGEDHTIINNYFQNISGIAGGVIVLTCGIPDSPLVGYWQIKKALVAHNTFVKNSAPCILLNAGFNQRGRTLLPENVTIAYNAMLADPHDENGKVLVVGKEGSGFKWMNNLAQGGEIGSAQETKITDLKLARGGDGLWRPGKDSPLLGAAKADLPKEVNADIDGQPRPREKRDIGCDQVSDAPVTNKPLTPAEVGPSWLKRGESQADAGGGDPQLAFAAEPQNKSLTLKNAKISAEFDPQIRRLAIRGEGGWAVESLALCSEVVNAGGLAMNVADYRDAIGDVKAIELRSEGGVQRIWLHENLPFVFTRANLLLSGTANEVKNLTPLSMELKPASLSLEKLKLLGSDGPAAAKDGKASYVFLAAVEPAGRNGMVAGWITHERGSGIVDSRNVDGKLKIDARCEYGKLPVNSEKEETQGETFAVGFFADAREGLEQFADVTAKVNQIKLPPRYSGYSTWYHAHALDQNRMAKLAQFCKENRLNEFGLNFLQIDDQWQSARRDFTAHKPNGPYSDGMKKTADTITANGFFAGLWLTPFGWNSKEGPLAQHQDWFVHRADGSVYDVKWAGDCLDMSNPQAREFLAGVIKRMTHDWGYKLLKIDGLWAGMAVKILYPSPQYRDDGLGDADFYDKNKTNVEVYRDGLRLVREAAGKDTFILGCNIAQNMRTMGGSIGLVDSMRVGPDIKADWGAVVRCVKPASWLYFWNGKVWHNDPDCIMLRDPLTLENARAWASWVALSGQLNLVSEWLPGLPPEKLELYKRTIPNHNGTARPVDLFERDVPQMWQLTSGEGEERRDLIGLFNWNMPAQATTKPASGQEEPVAAAESSKKAGPPVTLKIDAAQLGLPADQELIGFDYWDKKFVGPFKGEQSFILPPGTCKVIVVARKLDRPQVISTSRHVSQGIVDLTYVRWHNDRRLLEGKSRVIGGDDYELRIDAASLKAAADVSAEDRKAGVSAAAKQDGDELRVTVTSPVTREVAWEIRFTH